MNEPRELHETIDLCHHAVVEASAGTGKTYTIERLVARILRDVPEATVDRLLLLTYTEKATGELRERVRRFLELEAENSEGEAAVRLREAVEAFDTAQIFTIHGFCQRVLQEYAFENNQLFDLELSGDDGAARRLFRDQLRRRWPEEYLAGLSPETARAMADKGYMEDEILALAHAIQMGDRVLPEMPASLPCLVPAFAAALARVRGVAGDGSAFMARYWGVNLGKANGYSGLTRKSIEPIWQDVWETVAGSADEAGLRAAAARYSSIAYGRFQKGDGPPWEGFRVLVPPCCRGADGSIASPPDCPALAEVITVLADELEPVLRDAQVLLEDAHVAVVQAAAKDLQARYRAFKQEQGLMDFDDMLLRVHEALAPGNTQADVLLAALRAKYRFALVDEFQDTDPIQWDIFRRIFVENPEGPQRLLLIGDPKQAIYGFRGADVNTYLQARDMLVSRFGPQVQYSLNTNYRSIPLLLEGLNRAFSSSVWFPEPESGARISYEPVGWPQEDMRGVRVARDDTRRSPICLFHLDIPGVEDQKLTASQARRRLARSIAQEIEYLLADPKAFQFVDPDTDKVRELLPSDLCVLVRRRATARGVEEELRTRGIPYTFYKKTGIYQSAEALHTSLLLGALADPDATHSLQPALLSRFFGRTPRELAQNPAEVEQATRHHFVRWRELCRERRWAQLFAGLLEDTGLACREALEADGDRRLANFRQLFHDLVVLAESESLDVAGLREQLDLRRRRSVSVDGEADLHHLDTEKPKVTLMTMHASKGLQFPIVFIADGFSELGRVDGSMIHYHQDGQRVTELKTSQGFAGKATASQESEEETRRLFYVALTRARFKVYIPFGWNPGKDEPKPLTPLLTPAFEPFWDCGDDMQNNEMVCHLTYKGEITGTGYPMPPVDTIRELIPASLPAPVGADEVLQVVEGLVPVPSLRRWQRQVDSYSSLAQDHERAPRMSFGEGGHEEEGDDWSAPALEQTLVPPGAAAGTALHEILEQVDFATLGECRNPENLLGEHPALAETVARCMARNGLANQIRGQQSTQLELARMAWRAVTTPLGPDGFCLAQVPASDRQSELEFHLSEGEDWLGWSAAVPSDRRGLLNGFVDLVYRWQGQYYIVDWKSNALPGGYARSDVMASMEEHEYTLQYRIYALALAAWLRTCLPDFSPDLHLGGVYYLYVRGLNGVDATEGVFYQRLGEEQLAEYRQDVLGRLAAHS